MPVLIAGACLDDYSTLSSLYTNTTDFYKSVHMYVGLIVYMYVCVSHVYVLCVCVSMCGLSVCDSLCVNELCVCVSSPRAVVF